MLKLKVVVCLISVNFFKNEKYVLSTNNQNLILPSLEISDIDNMNITITDHINSLFIDKLKIPELNRIKFISFNDQSVKQLFPNDSNTLHILYGGAMTHAETNQYWFPFDYMDLNIQKELSIINKTIQHAI